MLRKFTVEECKAAIAQGDFALPSDLSEAGMAIILTQSWCPQWKAMKAYLETAEKAGAAILYVEYDTESFFEDFMRFKEETYKNREIPYVRYFQNGVFSGDSNYVSLGGFLHRLGL
jgi:glutaredoxin